MPVATSNLTLTGHALDTAPADVNNLHPGMMVGPYRLIRLLGRGGMGQVWLAEQTAPLKREVAIKMLARKLNDRMAEAWFLVERQALAMLVHPYIAQIFDAGQLPGGAMFFAMEYIEGSTLDRWVNQRSPDLPTLAALFERICTGIQYAHQRGLIHRDLKPANLLVRDDGQQALPKIIDFGVAVGGVPGQQVQIDQKVTIGTAAYMAPEQSRPTAEGIDARADVYALGATLANLLCDRAGLEIEVKHALSHVAASMARTGASGPGVVTPKPALHALRKNIPKELRAIAVKAMAHDRDQRYESAAAMGADLQRWRLGNPVLAMEGGWAYAVRCFVRRYRWASAAAATAVLALVVGVGAALYGLSEARHAQAVAEQRRVQAENLVGVMLGDLATKLRPLGQLELLETVGDEAMRYLSAAARTDGAQTGSLQRARALRTLGEVYVNQQQLNRAAKAFAEADNTLAGDKEQQDSDLVFEQAQIAFWRGNLPFLATDNAAARVHWDRYLELAQRLTILEPNSVRSTIESAYARTNLAALDLRAGKLDAALSEYRLAVQWMAKAQELEPNNDTLRVDLANLVSSLGSTLEAAGRPTEAVDHFGQQIALLRTVGTTDARSKHRLALALHLHARTAALLGESDALQNILLATDLLADLVVFDPANQLWRKDLLAAMVCLAEVQMTRNQDTHAIQTLNQALAKAELLIDQQDPGTSSLKFRAHLRSAIIAAQAGDTKVLEEHLAATSAVANAARNTDSRLRDGVLFDILRRSLQMFSDSELVYDLEHRALEEFHAPLGALALEAQYALIRNSGDIAALARMERTLEDMGYDATRFGNLIF